MHLSSTKWCLLYMDMKSIRCWSHWLDMFQCCSFFFLSFFFKLSVVARNFPKSSKCPINDQWSLNFQKKTQWKSTVFLELVSCHLYMMRFVLSCWNESSRKRKCSKYKCMQMICSKIFICHTCQQRLLVIFANSNETHPIPTCISCWQAGSITS